MSDNPEGQSAAAPPAGAAPPPTAAAGTRKPARKRSAKPAAGKGLKISLVVGALLALLGGVYLLLPKSYERKLNLATGATREHRRLAGLALGGGIGQTERSRWVASLKVTPAPDLWVVAAAYDYSPLAGRSASPASQLAVMAEAILDKIQQAPSDRQADMLTKYESMISQLQGLPGLRPDGPSPTAEEAAKAYDASNELVAMARLAGAGAPK